MNPRPTAAVAHKRMAPVSGNLMACRPRLAWVPPCQRHVSPCPSRRAPARASSRPQSRRRRGGGEGSLALQNKGKLLSLSKLRSQQIWRILPIRTLKNHVKNLGKRTRLGEVVRQNGGLSPCLIIEISPPVRALRALSAIRAIYPCYLSVRIRANPSRHQLTSDLSSKKERLG